jgi:hypothetical protein
MDIPTESTAAGNVLAASAFLAPMLAVATAYAVKQKGPALMAALLISAAVLGAGAGFALHSAPGEGTVFGAWVVGGWSFGLSVVMGGLVLGARTLHERGLAEDAKTLAATQAADGAPESGGAGRAPS